MVALSSQGWFRRWNESHYMILSGRRPAGRDRSRAGPRRRPDQARRARRGAAPRRYRHGRHRRPCTRSRRRRAHPPGRPGRRHHRPRLPLPQWLRELGLPSPEERRVDSGLAYAGVGSTARPGREPGTVPGHQRQAARGTDAGRGGRPAARRGRPLAGRLGTRGGEPVGRQPTPSASPLKNCGTPSSVSSSCRAADRGGLHPLHRQPPVLLRARPALARRLRRPRRRARGVQPDLRARHVGRGPERGGAARRHPGSSWGTPGLARAAREGGGPPGQRRVGPGHRPGRLLPRRDGVRPHPP